MSKFDESDQNRPINHLKTDRNRKTSKKNLRNRSINSSKSTEIVKKHPTMIETKFERINAHESCLRQSILFQYVFAKS